MAPTAITTGTAPLQGELWGARPRGWAEQEVQQRPLYEHALRSLGIREGTAVLDVGCGAGFLCRLAAAAGAGVTGIDAAETLIEIAKERVPEGEFHVGDLQFLPFAADAFDAVTGFNSFQYAADPAAALREAGRVAKPDSPVHAVVWGRENRTELAAILRALRPLLPPAPPDAPGPFALSEEGALEALVRQAGLEPLDDGYIEAAFEYRDEAALLSATLASGPATLAMRTSGEDAVREAALQAAAPFRTADGGYRIETEWRYVTARN
ncbi:MAG: methyltransferase domain-containing protein [Gaiellaceae bacterium]